MSLEGLHELTKDMKPAARYIGMKESDVVVAFPADLKHGINGQHGMTLIARPALCRHFFCLAHRPLDS